MDTIFKNDDHVHTNINNMDSISDNTEQKNTNLILSINDINKSIPLSASDKPNAILSTTHIEHRWRFFNINNKKLIEITVKHPKQPRKYINKSGEWIEYNLDDNWNMYLSYAKYYYTLT